MRRIIVLFASFALGWMIYSRLRQRMAAASGADSANQQPNGGFGERVSALAGDAGAAARRMAQAPVERVRSIVGGAPASPADEDDDGSLEDLAPAGADRMSHGEQLDTESADDRRTQNEQATSDRPFYPPSDSDEGPGARPALSAAEASGPPSGGVPASAEPGQSTRPDASATYGRPDEPGIGRMSTGPQPRPVATDAVAQPPQTGRAPALIQPPDSATPQASTPAPAKLTSKAGAESDAPSQKAPAVASQSAVNLTSPTLDSSKTGAVGGAQEPDVATVTAPVPPMPALQANAGGSEGQSRSAAAATTEESTTTAAREGVTWPTPTPAAPASEPAPASTQKAGSIGLHAKEAASANLSSAPTSAAQSGKAGSPTQENDAKNAAPEPGRAAPSSESANAGGAPAAGDTSGPALAAPKGDGPQRQTANSAPSRSTAEDDNKGLTGKGDSKGSAETVERGDTRAKAASAPAAIERAIKGNVRADGEKIYHMRGDPAYERVHPEKFFATPEEAEAEGFRRAGRPHG